MIEDPRVTAIGLHIEGINNIPRFSQAAKKALKRNIPIVALKTGTSDIGSELTLSHTSSLAGSDDLYQTLFNRLNICRADSMTSFLETLKLFSVTGNIKGRKLGVLTCSGGDSTLAADMAEKEEFRLPKLNNEQIQTLRTLMPEFAHVSNPLDYNTSIWGNETELERCFTTMAEGDFDAVILILDYLQPDKGNTQGWRACVNSLVETKKKTSMPIILMSILPEGIPEDVREYLIRNHVTPLQGLTDSFNALNLAAKYYQTSQSIGNAENIIDQFLLSSSNPKGSPHRILDEWESKQELAQYDLPLPKGQLVPYADGLNLSFEGPYVVKAVSSEIPHKTEAGAVMLNLRDYDSISKAIDEINKRTAHVSAENKTFLVEEMVSDAVGEIIIGLKRDDQFGLSLIIGTGGILVNLLNDSATILLPTNDDEIRKALYSLKGFSLLNGFRGRPKGDIESVIQSIKSIASYAEANYENILELDINPLLVLPEGKGSVAADALIRKQSDEF